MVPHKRLGKNSKNGYVVSVEFDGILVNRGVA